MLYPGYTPVGEDPWPVVLHYGITYSVGEYAFDKHWRARGGPAARSRCTQLSRGAPPPPRRHMATDMTSCPSRLFPRPPTLEELAPRPGSEEERRDAVALDCAWGLYDALRSHAQSVCNVSDPPDPPAVRHRCAANKDNVVVCERLGEDAPRSPPTPWAAQRAAARAAAAAGGNATANATAGGAGGGAATLLRGEAAVAAAAGGNASEAPPPPCADTQPGCCGWAAAGECAHNADFMGAACPAACARCSPLAPGAPPACPPAAAGAALNVSAATVNASAAALNASAAAGAPPPPPPAPPQPALAPQAVAAGGDGAALRASLLAPPPHFDPAHAEQTATPAREIKPHVSGLVGGGDGPDDGDGGVAEEGADENGEAAPDRVIRPHVAGKGTAAAGAGGRGGGGVAAAGASSPPPALAERGRAAQQEEGEEVGGEPAAGKADVAARRAAGGAVPRTAPPAAAWLTRISGVALVALLAWWCARGRRRDRAPPGRGRSSAGPEPRKGV